MKNNSQKNAKLIENNNNNDDNNKQIGTTSATHTTRTNHNCANLIEVDRDGNIIQQTKIKHHNNIMRQLIKQQTLRQDTTRRI